jgi:hypothetical protein
MTTITIRMMTKMLMAAPSGRFAVRPHDAATFALAS